MTIDAPNWQWAEDAPHVSGDRGTMALAVRNDTPGSLVNANGDYAPLQVDSGGLLRVTIPGTLAISGTVAVTQSTSPWVVSGSVTADTELPAASVLADADPNPTTSRIGSNLLGFNGATWDRLRSGGDNADNEAVVTLGALLTKGRNYIWDAAGSNWDRWTGAVTVTNTVTVTGTTTAVGSKTLTDAYANPTDDLDVAALNAVYNGATWDRQRSGGVLGMAGVAGAEAHDAAITGNPVLIGGRASVAAPADVSADGDVTRLWTTRAGRQRVYTSARRRTGLYYGSLGNTAVGAAADGALVGRFWLINPVGSTVFGAVRRIIFSMSTTTGLLEITTPIFTVERVTFTGTASGATITPMKRDSSDAGNSLSIRTASTGLTLTAGAAGHSFQCPAALATTSQNAASQAFPFASDEEEYVILRAGEGIVIRQATAGTVLDTRIANFDLLWEEFNSTDFKIND